MTDQIDFFPELVQPEHGEHATIQEKFETFHRANPWVYDALVTQARHARRRRFKRVGIGFLTELVRWQYHGQTCDRHSEFKINNNYRSRYTRLIANREADLQDFITHRELKSP